MGIGYQQTLNLSTPFSGKGIKKRKNKQDRPISQPHFFTHTVRDMTLVTPSIFVKGAVIMRMTVK